LYTECLSRGTGPLAIESLLLELLAVASATPARERRMPGWMRLVREMLHGGWRDTVRTAEAAAMAGVHPVYLARVFRRIAGCTLAEYVFRLRVQFACRRLAQPEVHLSTLALEAGFADQSHFTRVFKRVTGITPAAFRQAAFGAEGYAER
jgi:AraC-like DNA-binding protein